MSIARIAILSTFAVIYLAVVVFILIGGYYVSDVIFNSPRDQLEVVGLNSNAKVGFAKFTTILFWLIFMPLMFGPIVYLVAPKVYRIITDY